jgi:hypothetical protein
VNEAVGISQRDIFLQSLRDPRSAVAHGESAEVPIDTSLVPRVVDPRQYDAILARRKVRYLIEKERVSSGRRHDGRRDGRFKYVKRHLVAQQRPRNSQGTFLSTQTNDTRALAITN